MDYDAERRAFDRPMARLGARLSHLYLIHQPYGDHYGSWHTMEELLDEGRVKAIGAKYGKSVAQVILRWLLQRGIVCIPKSVHRNRNRAELRRVRLRARRRGHGAHRRTRYRRKPVPRLRRRRSDTVPQHANIQRIATESDIPAVTSGMHARRFIAGDVSCHPARDVIDPDHSYRPSPGE